MFSYLISLIDFKINQTFHFFIDFIDYAMIIDVKTSNFKIVNLIIKIIILILIIKIIAIVIIVIVIVMIIILVYRIIIIVMIVGHFNLNKLYYICYC